MTASLFVNYDRQFGVKYKNCLQKVFNLTQLITIWFRLKTSYYEEIPERKIPEKIPENTIRWFFDLCWYEDASLLVNERGKVILDFWEFDLFNLRLNANYLKAFEQNCR